MWGNMLVQASIHSGYQRPLTRMVPGLSSIITGVWCSASLNITSPWGRGGCLPPRTQGTIELALSCASGPPGSAFRGSCNLHSSWVGTERVGKSAIESVQKVGLSSGEKVTCAPSLESKSPPKRGTGHSGISLGAHLTFSGLAKRFNHLFSRYPSYIGSLFGRWCHRFCYYRQFCSCIHHEVSVLVPHFYGYHGLSGT